ncbi:acylphosphatase [Candidatus Woesearchaeota archaeon CG08_land_8_20_14_0_20_47_9]|nr:MAG: acylphosphatase [Candidatus Woesearchaeota archaeon CG08_land_8_20_14_0_20_47_9]
MPDKCVRLVITGKVQGVGFREFARQRADCLSIKGYVRNRRDGSLEILALGDEKAVNSFIKECRRGPLMTHIEGFKESAADPAECSSDEDEDGFYVRGF